MGRLGVRWSSACVSWRVGADALLVRENTSTLDWRGTYKIPSAGGDTDAWAVIGGAYDAQAAGLLAQLGRS